MKLLCLCQHKKRASKNNEINSSVKRPLREQRKVFGARIKIMNKEQLVDSLINFITIVIAPWFLVLNYSFGKVQVVLSNFSPLKYSATQNKLGQRKDTFLSRLATLLWACWLIKICVEVIQKCKIQLWLIEDCEVGLGGFYSKLCWSTA